MPTGVIPPSKWLPLFCAILSWLPAGLGYFWQLWDTDKLTWHDRLSQTRVIDISRLPAADPEAFPRVSELTPHSGGMCLLAEVLEHSAERTRCRVDPGDSALLADPDALAEAVGAMVRDALAAGATRLQIQIAAPGEVVSVGNLTVGGTGKTPLVVWLVLLGVGFIGGVLGGSFLSASAFVCRVMVKLIWRSGVWRPARRRASATARRPSSALS